MNGPAPQSERHLSRLELDRFVLLSEAGDDIDRDLSAHVEGCARCRRRLEQIHRADEAFMDRFPSAERLDRVAGRPERVSAVDVAEPASPWFRRFAYGGAALAAAAAMIVAVIVFRPSGPPSRKTTVTGPTVRAKGDSIIEVAVKRQGRSFMYSGQPLREGDVVAFRYTTKKHFLMILSLEQSGKINLFLTDPTKRRAMPIQPGVRIRLDRGIELDDYPGPELLIAILTDEPLEVTRVQSVLEKRYRSLSRKRKMGLHLGRLPLPGEVITWLIVKEKR
jgi:hypothetical protein